MSVRKFKKVLSEIECYQSFLISTHVNPDPDALASELVMALFLQSRGKKVVIYNEEPFPDRFAFFPRIRMLKNLADHRVPKFDAVVIVDSGDMSRIGKVRNLVPVNCPLVNIDHHVTNDDFGTVNLVCREASSTAEVIFDLLSQAKVPLTRETALLLYMGLMTDTGSFRYENTSAHTHEVAAALLRFDLPVSEIYRKIYESIPCADLTAFAKIIQRMELLFDGRVACVDLTRKTVAKFSESFDLRDKIFRYLRAIKGVDVVVIFTQQAKEATRVNFRSHSRSVDVARLAAYFQGGGHQRASGCLVRRDLPLARRDVLAKVEQALQRLGSNKRSCH